MEDLLKSVLGIGKNLSDFFNQKKRELLEIFSPEIKSPIPEPKISTYKPTPAPKTTTYRPTPKIDTFVITPPKLSYNEPKQTQKNDFLTEFFKNIATKTVPEAIVGIGKNIEEAGGQFGKGLGKTIQNIPINILGIPLTDAAQVEEITKVNQSIADRNLKLATNLVKQGKIEAAQRLFNANARLFNEIAAKNEEFRKQLEQRKRDLIEGGVKTGLYALGSNVLKKPAAVAGAALIGGGLDIITGGKEPFKAAGKAIADLPKYEAVLQFTNPLFSGAIGRIKQAVNNPIARQALGRTLSGLAGVTENEILAKLDKRDPTSYDRLLAFGLGALLSNGGREEDWEKLKKEVRETITKGGKLLGLD
ncbi:MAG: hypothetical protein ACUVQP_10965, partial [Bacteroidales bacterium]